MFITAAAIKLIITKIAMADLAIDVATLVVMGSKAIDANRPVTGVGICKLTGPTLRSVF